MSKAYGIDDEMAIAARAEMAVTGLTSGTVSDADATKILREVRLCATRANAPTPGGGITGARRETALAALDLIITLKGSGPRDQKIGRAIKAIEAWNRELATV
jgi:hypothetical protein